MQRPVLCCPEPAVKNAQHPHEVPDASRNIPTTPGYACSNPLFVSDCGPAVPPEPITLDGQSCDGAAKPATGMPGEIVQVVQAPGQVMTVRICENDRDFELSCGVDPETGHTIQTAYKIVSGIFELIKRWDVVTGAEWTGDPTTLQSCAGTKLESDGRTVCVDGTSLTQWAVKEDGVPTGTVYYTDADGALVDVPPSAVIVLGECIPACASVPLKDCSGIVYGHAYDVAAAAVAGADVPVEDCDGNVICYIFSTSGPGHTTPAYQGCSPDPQVLIGYAADIGCATDVVQESDPTVVCVDGVTMTQWTVKENGVPTGLVYYTDIKGQLVEVASTAVVQIGVCVPEIIQSVSSATADNLATLQAGTSFAIYKTDCCSIKLITSIGEIVIPKTATAYSTQIFKTPFEITAVEVVSGTCDLSEITVISNLSS